MPRLEYDFADQKDAKLFPAHGWAVNSQGVRILWCPLMRLFAFPRALLRGKGSSQTAAADRVLRASAFCETFRKLATTLRELHYHIRTSCDHPFPIEDPEVLRLDSRTYEMVPLYVDVAFTYLRRLPDLLVVACRALLFEHWQSVPQEFKCWVADVDRLRAHSPSCDFAILRKTIVSHSAWFDELRGTSPVTGKNGIRDALEHRDVRLLVGKQQKGNDRPYFHVMIDSRAKDVEIHKDIVPRIAESVAGLCRLMTGIHSAIGVGSQYEWGDYLYLCGTDDDIVGYWPHIRS